MKILAIETSCDETAVAILACEGDEQSAQFEVLSHALISQIDIHREFGGVFPAVAKREHAKTLVPLLANALEEAEMMHEDTQSLSDDVRTRISELLSREPDMTEAFIDFISQTERPDINAIAVTYGPGLEPALWVGVNFAQALSVAWNIPLVPVDHMEGHLMIALAQTRIDTGLHAEETRASENVVLEMKDVAFPVLALLISGGHTELDSMDEWRSYRRLGQTRDDAVGEAFDKAARMLGLPYPGGPEISRLAARDREDSVTNPYELPRPMIDRSDFDFSFSGLKTAVLYTMKNNPDFADVTQDTKAKEQLARAFEDAAADVLVAKTLRALEHSQAQTLAIGGGVSANLFIRERIRTAIAEKFPYVELRLPPDGLTGDNAVMIGLAGYYRAFRKEFAEAGTIIADGNLALAQGEISRETEL
ncbi:MAG: tRNA (adenosine(37)-N6)-threonylcarbamoyltransferase complex transferase subunit TsaD [Candidatus Pacebacteria bacterium]|nr:tRNA (adenosine(37)-N6)-threonylcarbamoyltransferase complex transferase subunit TsaD [Candidatus Paceibacterota bacterium]